MSSKRHGFVLLLSVCVGAWSSGARAAGETFAVSDEQLARLGVVLRPAQAVEVVEYAAAPAVVVVPPARQALVNASHGGVVVRVLVAEGDAVTAQQAVAEIDSLDYV